MKYPLSFLLCLMLFFGCTEKQPKSNNDNSMIIEVQKILSDWNIESVVSREESLDDVKLSIEIIKPQIIHKDHASIIASCVAAKQLSFPKNKSVTINISSKTNGENNQLSGVTYSQENITSLIALFGDSPLLRLNEYCIKNFEASTASDFEKLMTKNHELEKWAIEGSFFQLIYQFFKESKGYEKGKNATLTIFFLYITTSDFMQGTELEYLSTHLKNLWRIMRNQEIMAYEKEFIKIINGK